DNTFVDDKKDYRAQEKAVLSVLRSCNKNKEVDKAVKGFLVESFIKSGSQDLKKTDEEEIDLGGLSVTDACIGINETRALIEKIVKFR
ncbi:MAG: 3-deoxy-7-phosphoheptulonate synthase, partial [Patescibacteria group bacterium]